MQHLQMAARSPERFICSEKANRLPRKRDLLKNNQKPGPEKETDSKIVLLRTANVQQFKSVF